MTCFLLYFLEYIKTQILISLFAILPNVIAHHSYRQRNINFSPRFSCETLDLGRDTFLHSFPFPPRIMNKFRQTFGEAWRNVGGYLCYGQTSHPGGVAKPPVTSCHRNLDKVRLNGHLSWQILPFPLFTMSGKLDNLWCNEATIIHVIVIFRVTICLNSIFVELTDWLFRQPECSRNLKTIFATIIDNSILRTNFSALQIKYLSVMCHFWTHL